MVIDVRANGHECCHLVRRARNFVEENYRATITDDRGVANAGSLGRDALISFSVTHNLKTDASARTQAQILFFD